MLLINMVIVWILGIVSGASFCRWLDGHSSVYLWISTLLTSIGILISTYQRFKTKK